MANPGASFFDREGNFSRQKCARMSARSARDSIMRPLRHQSRENAKRAASAACQRVDCGITKTCRTREGKPPSAAKRPICKPWDDSSRYARFLSLSQTSDTLPNALSLTRSTIPPPHHKSVPAASPQTEKFPRSSQPSAPAQPPIHPSY